MLLQDTKCKLSQMNKEKAVGNLQWPSEKALCSLLDDESAVVRKSIFTLFESFPEHGRSFLNKLISQSDDLAVKHAREIQKELGWTDGKEDFLNFIRSKRYELETGWYLLDRVVYPNLDSSVSSLQLDELADRVRDLLTAHSDPKLICLTINRVLFHEYGFRGAGKDFENPQNSFLHQVLEKKKGLPITLSLIYILVARRAGFDLEPIGLPGRFMVGCFAAEMPFYIDVWAGGKMIDLEEMGEYMGISIEESSGGILLPVTVADMLARGCRNLAHHFSIKGQRQEAAIFLQFVSEFEKILGMRSNA